MGKKPVLGLVSAVCVGLALTGCRNTDASGDGSLAKSNGSQYHAPSTWQMNAANTTTPAGAGNTTTPAGAGNTTALRPGNPSGPFMSSGAAPYVPTTPGATPNAGSQAPIDPMNTLRPAQTIQTTDLTGPTPPAQPTSYHGVTPAPMNAAPPPGDIHEISSQGGRALPPVPNFTSGAIPSNLPDMPPDAHAAPVAPALIASPPPPPSPPPGAPTAVPPPVDPTPPPAIPYPTPTPGAMPAPTPGAMPAPPDPVPSAPTNVPPTLIPLPAPPPVPGPG